MTYFGLTLNPIWAPCWPSCSSCHFPHGRSLPGEQPYVCQNFHERTGSLSSATTYMMNPNPFCIPPRVLAGLALTNFVTDWTNINHWIWKTKQILHALRYWTTWLGSFLLQEFTRVYWAPCFRKVTSEAAHLWWIRTLTYTPTLHAVALKLIWHI